jgi:hypothetical protein
MATATVHLGRLVIREDRVVAETVDPSGVRILSLSGQESRPRLTAPQIHRRREDILAMEGSFLSATFTTKTYLDGFYSVQEASGEINDLSDDLVMFRWSLRLARVGTTAEIDLESRLSGAITRANAFVATGERSHAPSAGAAAYWAGPVAPTTVDRACADGGTIRVYRGLGATVNPRWATTPAGYRAGRCRLSDHLGNERAGLNISLDPAQSWEMHNGVVKITPGSFGGTFDLSVWDTGAWAPATPYSVQIGNPYVAVPTFDYLTVLRNTFEAITLRCTKSLTPSGRFHVDVTLRRGSRFTELYLQHEYSTQLQVIHVFAEAGSQTSGYLTANANDASGNRYLIGSAGTFTPNTANGGLEKTATTTLDVVVGVVLDGSGAVAGDTAAALYAQYLGIPGEVVQGVRR